MHLPKILAVLLLFMAWHPGPSLWQYAAGEDSRVLYVYTWEDYFDPAVVTEFERQQNCRVDFDYFDSYDTMFERVRHGGSGYDLITPAANLAEQMSEMGLLRNINRRLIPNMRHLDTTLLAPFPDLEMRYHVPYTWSLVGVGYNKNMITPENLGSWNIYGRPGNEKRAALMNEPRHVIGAALKYLGYSVNSTNPDEIRQAGRILADWKKSVAMFGVIQPVLRLEKGELAFIQGFSGDLAVAVEGNPDLGLFIPKEGSILHSDCFVIPDDAENHELAHAFINHMFNPGIAARNMEALRHYMPNRAALARFKAEFKNDPFLFFPKKDLEISEAIHNVGESQKYYDEAWEALLIEGN